MPGAASRSIQADNSVLPGLQAAVDSICQCTDVQHEKRTSLSDNANKVSIAQTSILSYFES